MFSGSFFYFLTAVGTLWSAAGQIKPITGATHPTAKKINNCARTRCQNM